MKKRIFNVAVDSMLEFCTVHESNDLSNEIIGVTYDNEFIIKVSNNSFKRIVIFELIEITDDEINQLLTRRA